MLADQAKEVIYYYKKKAAADVTVKYLNEKDEEIQASKTIKGKVGDDYDATTAEYKFDTIGDYELDTSKLPTNAKGKFDDQAKEVIYYYKKKAAADVTVKYLNEKDEEVQASKTIKGKVGDDYDATTAEYKFDTIGNYELDTSKLPTNAKGKFDDQAKEVIYYYKKKAAADVTVQYLNEANQEIHSAKTISGKVGDDYDATTPEYKLPTIDDYVLDESKLPTNAEGKLDDTAKTVTYYYKKAPVPVTGKVTVKYVNETDEEIRTEKSFTGEVDKAYDAMTPEYKLAMIDEYVLDESKLPANGKGVFTAAEQTVVYHYKKASAPATSKVIVKYVDEAGQEIREAQTMKGKIGTAYDATTEEYKLAKIDDYVLDETQLPTNGKGQFSATNQPVVYHYKKDSTPIPPMTSKVTVKYVDEADREIREVQTIKGEIGTAYDATTADYKLSKIGDYQLDETKLPSNGKGQFGDQEQLVTYVYKKAPKLANTNNKSSATGTNTIVTRVSGVNQKLLPKTGEHTLAANILVVVGMVMIVSALMIFVRKRNI
ncbi:MAG: MucBP domain-containing protein [Enterococcus avium]